MRLRPVRSTTRVDLPSGVEVLSSGGWCSPPISCSKKCVGACVSGGGKHQLGYV